MSHLSVDILVPYLDGELSSEEMSHCREHLRVCAVCRREAEQLGDVWSVLDAAPAPVVPGGFAASVLARVADEPTPTFRSGGRRSLLLRIAVPVGVAAAVGLAVLFWPAVPGGEQVGLPTAGPLVTHDQTPELESEIELILENREVLDAMEEYPDLIEHYDVLRAVDRLLHDEQATS